MKAKFYIDETEVTLDGTPQELAEMLKGLGQEEEKYVSKEEPSWLGVQYFSNGKGWVTIEEMSLLHVFNAANKILRTGYRNGETLQSMTDEDDALREMLARISVEGHLLGRK